MHKFHLGIVTFVFAIASAHAGPPATSLDAVAVRDNAHLVIDCGAERLPSRRSVGDVLDSNNASFIETERERLIHIAHRECMRGAGYVVFVREATGPASTLALLGS